MVLATAFVVVVVVVVKTRGDDDDDDDDDDFCRCWRPPLRVVEEECANRR